MEQIAAIADVHGNVWALDVVLADIARRGIATIVNLGDSLYGSLDPAGAAERLMRPHIRSIAGNQERDLVAPDAATRSSADYAFVAGQLGPAQLAWAASCPPTLALGEVLCCHGTPSSDTAYLLEEVTEQGARLAGPATIAARLAGVGHALVLCGHSHVPRVVGLPDGRLVVNPGSVGMPAYDEDQPHPHVMEAGSPHARYAVLTRGPRGWDVELVALSYDWGAAAAAALARGRPDRARWIMTGRAAG